MAVLKYASAARLGQAQQKTQECCSSSQPRPWEPSPRRGHASGAGPSRILSAIYVTSIPRRTQTTSQITQSGTWSPRWPAYVTQWNGPHKTARTSKYGRTNAADDSTQRHGTARAPGLWRRDETTTKCPGWSWDAWHEHGTWWGQTLAKSSKLQFNPLLFCISRKLCGTSRRRGPTWDPNNAKSSRFNQLWRQHVLDFGMAGMEPHHMNGSLGSGDMDSLPKNSPGNLSMSNQPGTPREDGEMGGNFLNPFQNESYSPNMTMSV
ncbi:hypothetical protein PFLUV_G00069390 [Perca fluviatilis]|uniref:Uncharacterized protein n=1 Tax=Perca fluviatilis TaxID=8168 RepID=A0A6A5EIA2_PERFL|nr:hypothetical protein PFLUV_G00069390 [Perca fluviatilis]